MNQRSLGILGAAFVIGGIALGLASGIADRQVASRNTPATGIHRPNHGNFPGQISPGQHGPAFGGPGQRGFPGFDNRPPANTNPRPSPSG